MLCTPLLRWLQRIALISLAGCLGAAIPLRAQETDFTPYGIYQATAPRPPRTDPQPTPLPLELRRGDRIALVGNTLFDRLRLFGSFETLLQQNYPDHRLVVRNLAWSADEIDIQPRPDNFADVEQHLNHQKIDVIFAAFGFNESFAGVQQIDSFKLRLTKYLDRLKRHAYNGRSAPRIVLVSPTSNENVVGVRAADLNNKRLREYVAAMQLVAQQQRVGFVDVFEATWDAMQDPASDLTINGCHLTQEGYDLLATKLFRGAFGKDPLGHRGRRGVSTTEVIHEPLRQVVIDKNRQFFRRYRPLNTFYYTGGRNKSYGYLDFLPAMRNFDRMVSNRDELIWSIALGGSRPQRVDDSNVPSLPSALESRAANRWMSAADELKAFQVDARFDVNLFAGEEEFPDIAAPIQMRWDSQGRLWVSCSTTYPHVYPGSEPNDKLVVLEDRDGDGRADKSTVFADDLHIPLSFEFGDGGVYVSEMPHLSFLRDSDGDGRADFRQVILTGFGTEDSHHSLHDITWTPDGDLMFRESIFHHSQVETPYGPVRQLNSGWFRFQPRNHRLTSFGTYHSTNPWGVTFDDWGQHVASHPIYAAAFHSLDPAYPQQHPRPSGLQAYSGTCGQEFVDFQTFPEDLRGTYIKARYKPTNRIEIHNWVRTEFGYDEQYLSDLIFSTNLSFIPVDIRFGPRGALYICDWYNPVKGHAQYSLRDERRDRHSGRIWRVTCKERPLQSPVKVGDATTPELLQLLTRAEYRYRYWAKRELRQRNSQNVLAALEAWTKQLDAREARYRHHQLEAVWMYRWLGKTNTPLLRELLGCEISQARAAATEQLRYWHQHMPDAIQLLQRAANDPDSIVRMQAVIAASYIGTQQALDAILDVFRHPHGGHLDYAIRCSLGSQTLRRHWQEDPNYQIADLLKQSSPQDEFKQPRRSPAEVQFDSQPNLKRVSISCQPERMLFTVDRFTVEPGQPVKLVFTNPDATDHNLVIVRPASLAEVGMAANEMARDPRNANSDFLPPDKRHLVVHASPMIGPTRAARVHVLRFKAPHEPGIYPYVCTFPGHWVVMNGLMVVAQDEAAAKSLLADAAPKTVKNWELQDFRELSVDDDEQAVARGMQAFVKARCNQCHVVAGHGVNLGPDLVESVKRLRGLKLLEQILKPSTEINEKFQMKRFELADGRTVAGVVTSESKGHYRVVTNMLTPHSVTQLPKKEVENVLASRVSPMPEGLVNVLTRQEILDLVAFVQSGGYQLPRHLQHVHEGHQ